MSRSFALPSRRLLLAGLGLTAVGAVAAPIARLSPVQPGSRKNAAWWDKMFPSLKHAGVAEWTGLVGEIFSLGTAAGDHVLRIVAVRPFAQSGARPRSLGRASAFSVAFEQMAGKPVPSADLTVQLTHRAWSPLPIYMSAPVRTGTRTRLVAVFN